MEDYIRRLDMLAAGAGFSYGKSFAVPWYIVPAIVAIHSIWVRGVYVGNQNDLMKAYHFRQEAERCLLDANHKRLRSPDLIKRWSWRWFFGFLTNWANLFELLATAALATALWIISQLSHPLPQIKPN